MFSKFQEHITNNFSYLNEKKLLVAVSGGLDSVVLTHLLSNLNCNLSIAHCNFKLRPSSNLDEEFTNSLGKKLDIPVFTKQFNTKEFARNKKLSTQLAARQLRYEWFHQLKNNFNFDYVLTAHHLDDSLETFLINLTRGTGLDGLMGIPSINEKTIRPLLPFSKTEIKEYALKNKIIWREDESNAQTKYTRNKIRHKVIPVLKEINPNLLTSFNKTVQHLNDSQSIINEKITESSRQLILNNEDGKSINILKLLKLQNPKAYLYYFLKNYGFTEWNDVYNLLTAQTGKQVFSKTHVVLKNRDFLLLNPINKNESKSVFFIESTVKNIVTPIAIQLKSVNKIGKTHKKVAYVEKNLLNFPLILRKWETGDNFFPSGMRGTKKLSKYFKDKKLSLRDKESVWILCNNDNKIIWIVGFRQDKRFLATEKSKELLKITITPK